MKIYKDSHPPTTLVNKPSGYWVSILSSMKIGDQFLCEYRDQQKIRRQLTRYSTGDLKHLNKNFYMMLLPSDHENKKFYSVLRVSKNFKPVRKVYHRRDRSYWLNIFDKMKKNDMLKINETEIKNCSSALGRYADKYKNKLFRSKCVGEDKKGLLLYQIWRLK